MRYLTRIWRNLRHRRVVEAELDAELGSWVDMETDRNVAAGMPQAEARRMALAASGGVAQVKERVRDVRAAHWIETLWQDLRFGQRLMRKQPGFTAACLVILGLGIGGNTAVFSVLNAVLMRGLPYAEAERIVAIYEKRLKENDLRNVVSPADFVDWRTQSQSLEHISAVVHDSVTWHSSAGAEQIVAGRVSPAFFQALGVPMAIGAGFRKETLGPQPEAVLTHGFWRRRFGGDPGVLGQSININGTPRPIVGVLPENFDYPVPDLEVFVPLTFSNTNGLNRTDHVLNVAARLKPGVTLSQAQAEMDAIAARLEQQFPSENKGHGANVVPMRDVLIGPMKNPLYALQFAVLFVLLIACANFANLLLARTLAREKELAVRLAIGASRGRVLRQLLSESVLLAMAGGAAGVIAARLTVPLLVSLIPPDAPLIGIRNAQVDGTVLASCLLISLLCGIGAGLTPALRATAVPVAWSRRDAVRRALVASQVALAVVLLTGSGIALRSFAALRSVDPGLRADRVLTGQVSLPGARYKDAESVLRLTSAWIERLRRAPGVESVGTTSHIPLSGMDGRRGLAVEGVPPPDPNVPRRAHMRLVSPEYFRAVGMRMIAGREFSDADRAGSAPVMIVNETAARRYFPDGKAIGHRAKPGGNDQPWHEVVGVVADVHHWGLDVEPRPEQYYSSLQSPSWMVALTLRGVGDLAAIARSELRAIDPLLPLARVQTLEEIIGRSIATERSILLLLGAFAALALALTASGIWATMSYLMSQRRREIGIRLALGARENSLVRTAAGEAMRFAGVGIGVGLLLAAAAAKMTALTVYGVSLLDPAVYAGAAALVCLVAWVANYVPARRIARSVPLSILRLE